MTIVSSENLSHALVITDTNIKNNMATSIVHVHICNRPVTKTLYHIVNVNSMEAELFTIRCSINQAINSMGILKIIIITDSIHTAKKYSIYYCIYFKFIQCPSFINFKSSLYLIKTIQLNSGNILVDATGHFIKWSTKKQNHSIPVFSSHANHLRTTVRKKNVINYPILGK